MVRRSLSACIAGVLLAHACLIWTFLHSAPSGAAVSVAPARPRLGVRTAMQVFTLTAPPRRALAPARQGEPLAAAPPSPRLTGEASPKPPPARSRVVAPDILGPAPVQVYRTPGELDRAALPLSSPDLDMLAGLPWTGLPLRLRLFIDAKGTVVEVRVLKSSEDPELLDRIRAMFLATGFVPGRLHGVDVASYKELELSLRPLP